MRTFEEIHAEIKKAMWINDSEALRRLAPEMQALVTPEAEATSLRTVGVADELNGDYTSALELYRRALAVREALGDRDGAAILINDIGNVHQRIGDHSTAMELYRQALAVHVELGNREYVATATMNMGAVYFRSGDYPSALKCYHRALAVAIVTSNMGIVYQKTGDNPAALEHYQRSRALHEQEGNRAHVVHVTGNMIEALIDADQFHEAEKQLERQATMQMDDRTVRAWHEAQRASIAEHRGDRDASRDHLQQALAIAVESGLRADAMQFHEKLRDLAKKRNDFEGYVRHNDEYHRISDEIRGKEATQKMAMQDAERKAEAVEREHDKERALLYGALPESVANRMLRGEDVSGDHYESVSVIFLDIVNFTSLSDRIPPGHVVYLLEQIFSALDDVCAKHGVTKIKTIGDSYMAVAFGIANSEQRIANNNVHIVNAALCALEMISSLNALDITMPPALGDTSWTKDVGDIKVRIGVHCGPVTAGVIGKQRLQYDVWGDTVNVASRMESTSEPNRIHVSQQFKEATEHVKQKNEEDDLAFATWHLAFRGETSIKGKGTMKTFWLEGA